MSVAVAALMAASTVGVIGLASPAAADTVIAGCAVVSSPTTGHHTTCLMPAPAANFSGVNLSYANFSNANLTNATFAGANLMGASFAGATLAGADLTGANLTNVVLDGANIAGSHLFGATFMATSLGGALYSNLGPATGVPLTLPTGFAYVGSLLLGPGLRLDGYDLSNLDLSGIDLSNTTLVGVVSGGITGTPGALPVGTVLLGGYLIGPGVVLSGADLSGVDLHGVDLSGADLSGAILAGANLAGANLSSTGLAGVDLSHADLVGANMFSAGALCFDGSSCGGTMSTSGGNLTDANLTGANLTFAFIPEFDTSGADFTNATFTGLNAQSWGYSATPPILPTGYQIRSHTLVGPYLDFSFYGNGGNNYDGADFSGLDLTGAYFAGFDVGDGGTSLIGVNFSGSNLTSADFTGANLSGANLHGTNLTQTDVTAAVSLGGVTSGGVTGTPADHVWGGYLIAAGVDASYADLHGAQLGGLDLSGINLEHANLRSASLHNTILDSADLTFTDFTGADLTGTDFNGAMFGNNPGWTWPQVTLQPKSQKVLPGTSVTFTAAASGTPTPQVQWQVSTDGGATFEFIPGATSTTFTKTVGLADAGLYEAYFTNPIGFDTTAPATLNVGPTVVTVSSGSNPSTYGQSTTLTASVTDLTTPAASLTGTMTFYNGKTVLGTAMVAGGTATLTTAILPAGDQAVTAKYTRGTGFVPVTSVALNQHVDSAATSVAVSSSTPTSVHGQPVTITATITALAPGGGVPTGTVTFYDPSNRSRTAAPVVNGHATLTSSTLTTGTHPIEAWYSSANANYIPSNSTPGAFTQAVQAASTSLTIGTSAASSVYGQPISISATVAAVPAGAGVPTGTVTFTDLVTSAVATVNLVSGRAVFTSSTWSPGVHTFAVQFGGSTDFTPSSGVATQTVAQAGTTTAVASTVPTSAFGQAVTISASVKPVTPSAVVVAAGSVTFYDGPNILGTATVKAGVATLAANKTLALGPHTITAAYSGSTNQQASFAGTFTQTVTPDLTSTVISSAPASSVFGQSVTIKATVKAVAPGTGTVGSGSITFYDGATLLGTVPVMAGVATLPATNQLTVSTHVITATYSGSTNQQASNSNPYNLIVHPAVTTVTLTSSRNPAPTGAAITFTATVKPVAPGTGAPTGTVSFYDGTTLLATVDLTTGKAVFATATLTTGSHQITAVFSATSNYNASTSAALAQVVS